MCDNVPIKLIDSNIKIRFTVLRLVVAILVSITVFNIFNVFIFLTIDAISAMNEVFGCLPEEDLSIWIGTRSSV